MQTKLKHKIEKEANQICYEDVWNLTEVSISRLLSIRKKRLFIRSVYLHFLKRYPTEREYTTLLVQLLRHQCKKIDIIKMVQEFEEAKQYPKLKIVE